MKRVELLSPAKDITIGMAAINHGADAVYIGAPAFGARKAAGNSLEDLRKLVEYAHRFYCKVFVTLNTILYDQELPEAERLIREIYSIGADALIVQDPGILKLDIPPISLHASTQMHNYDLDRIKFLDRLGFQRLVLARELSLEQLRTIRKEVKAELEMFVHGALCVSLSGQCYLSQYMFGRSANRGECAQPCRMKWSVKDSAGKVLVRDKYVLSLKDLNLSAYMNELIGLGIDSFKIEGRL
ncbi:MAG: U32 family peptidase, partial [Odoribacter splanchnicus]|nr:U32 family peptidase [Odoribacter splanchnicus]